jgi:hypothetical protein
LQQATHNINQNTKETTSCILPVSEHLAIHAYSDTRPHNMKISELQKGLILTWKQTELIGEGTGFGVPVLIYKNETCFSSTATLQISTDTNSNTILTKNYHMHRTARNSFRNVTLQNHTARILIDHLSSLYQEHPNFRNLTLKNLTSKIGIGKAYAQTTPKGTINVTYTIHKHKININADLKNITRTNLKKIFILNEQGTTHFRKYRDPTHKELVDDKIGAWDNVEGEWACIETLNGHLGFRVKKTPKSLLRRGREYLKNSLDWIGLDYEVDPSLDHFTYTIDLLEP